MKNTANPFDFAERTDLQSALLIIQKQQEENQKQAAEQLERNRMIADYQDIVMGLKKQVEGYEKEGRWKDAKIESLTFEIARLKRWKFAAQTEGLNVEQLRLFEESLEADIEAVEAQLEALKSKPAQADEPKSKAKRKPFPDHLERLEHRYEPDSCSCHDCGSTLKKIGEEISEQLDCKPIEFFVHRHIRSKYACPKCETIQTAAIPAQLIDKGQPAPGLLAQVLLSKYQDHLPLYCQEQQYQERSGVVIPRNTMAGWVGACGVALSPLVERMHEHLLNEAVLHADETPVSVLKPGNGKTHRGYMWTYRTGEWGAVQAVIFDFQMSRAGEHPKAFLKGFNGALMIDHYAGYNTVFKDSSCTELACLVHVRRKFFELHEANKSQIAQEALVFIGKLYAIEKEARDFTPEARKSHRDHYARPVLDAFHRWLTHRKGGVPGSSGIANALDYALKRFDAILHYLDDGRYPIDNNLAENAIRPIAVGRKNWMFMGTEQAGKRAAAIMSLIASARLNGLNPYLYLKDVLTRLPTHPYSQLDELLPYRWKPSVTQ
jgi:transposase